MSTTANIIFANNYYDLDIEENIDKIFSEDFDYIKKGSCVYLYWDGYPSNVLELLQEYLSCNGSKKRAMDNEYLSAWFVAYICVFKRLSLLSADTYFKNTDNYSTEEYNKFINNYTPNITDFRTVTDFSGLGLGLYDSPAYTYVITGDYAPQYFKIWIYDKNNNFIDVIVYDEDLSNYFDKDWW